jgi:hypothetical protein
MTRFEAAKFCARLRLNFGLNASLEETFLNKLGKSKGLLKPFICSAFSLFKESEFVLGGKYENSQSARIWSQDVGSSIVDARPKLECFATWM